MLIVTTRIEPTIACGAGDGIRVSRQKAPIPKATRNPNNTFIFVPPTDLLSTTESRLSFAGYLEKPERVQTTVAFCVKLVMLTGTYRQLFRPFPAVTLAETNKSEIAAREYYEFMR